MRFFLNVIYEFKKSRNAFGTTLSAVRKTLEENNWNQKRILFHFKDINDAAEEKSTVHSKMIRKYPQMEQYWNSDHKYHAARSSFVCGNPPRIVTVKPHQHSHFTNFPGWKEGKAEYMRADHEITDEMIQDICDKIPKPYTFYEAVVVLDGIDWFGGCNLSPAIEWSVVKSEQEAGNWPQEPTVDEAFSEYQSNSVRLAKRFDMGLELALQIELTDKQGMDDALKIITMFEKQFGSPVKQYVRARGSWEERSAWREKSEKAQHFFDLWTKTIGENLSLLYKREREGLKNSQKSVSRKTMQKRFLENNHLYRHKMRRWDDYGWHKALPWNYQCHIELMVNQKQQENTKYNLSYGNVNIPVNVMQKQTAANRYTPANGMSVHCYGCNFDIVCNVLVEDFISDAGDCAGEIAFLVFEEFLHRFEEEAVPEIAEIYGKTPEIFVQESYARDYIHNERCIAGIIEVPG